MPILRVLFNAMRNFDIDTGISGIVFDEQSNRQLEQLKRNPFFL
jgi:hypothetical protein